MPQDTSNTDSSERAEVTPASTAARQHQLRLRRYRRIQVTGGFLLACTFFLPAVNACNSSISPYQHTMDIVTAEDHFGLGEALLLLFHLSPYLWGLLIFLTVAAARRSQTETPMLPLALAFAGGLALTLFLLIGNIVNGDPMDQLFMLFATLAAISIPYWWKAVHKKEAGVLSLKWHGTICVLLWLLTLSRIYTPLYGLLLSIAGCALIATGCFLEAKLRGHRMNLFTLRSLLACAIEVHDTLDPRCRRCGYILTGLRSLRCPECGTPFQPVSSQLPTEQANDTR